MIEDKVETLFEVATVETTKGVFSLIHKAEERVVDHAVILRAADIANNKKLDRISESQKLLQRIISHIRL